MDWSNERYVRVYTRDTGDWLALSYQAQCLMLQLLRKVDRSGVLDLGRQGLKAVAVILQQVALWESTIAPALQELLADGCVQLHESLLVIPNFTPAQEAAQSDKFRAQESRARRREAAMRGDTIRNGIVTNRDKGGQNGGSGGGPLGEVPHRVPMSGAKSVDLNGDSLANEHSSRGVTNRDNGVTNRDASETNGDASVTRGHSASQPVTARHSSLTSQTRILGSGFDCVSGSGSSFLDQSSSSGWQPDSGAVVVGRQGQLLQLPPAKAPDPARVEAAAWLDWFNREFHRQFTLRDELVKQVRALLAKKYSQQDMRMVALFKQHQWQSKPEMQAHLVPPTLLRLNTFGSYLDQAREWFGPEESHGS